MINNNIASTGVMADMQVQSSAQSAPKSNELGQDAFLELMITQMNNQNPLDPQKNSEFVAQLAQFSSVEGLGKLNETMSGMALSMQSSQALQASSLVGRTVKIETSTAELEAGGNISGTIELPFNTPELTMNIYNEQGELVGEQYLGQQGKGDTKFVWDGMGSDGKPLPPGRYHFAAIGDYNGQPVQLGTSLSANVDSVTIGHNGQVILNVAGVGPTSTTAVKEIL